MTSPSTTEPALKVALNRYGYNTIARNMSIVLITSLPLFLVAGTWSWGWAWVYTAVSFIGWAWLNYYVARVNPGLFNERGKPTRQLTANSKKWDLPILTAYSLLMFITPIVAGLDYRNGWSGETHPAVQVLGIALLAFGFVPLAWGMAVNKFFEPTVRIQSERGHRVADSGPYRYVRHPGYVGVILHFVAVPFALGTWAAVVPAFLAAALYVLRTALEDRTLRQELPGYEEFTQRTRYRLFPGIW